MQRNKVAKTPCGVCLTSLLGLGVLFAVGVFGAGIARADAGQLAQWQVAQASDGALGVPDLPAAPALPQAPAAPTVPTPPALPAEPQVPQEPVPAPASPPRPVEPVVVPIVPPSGQTSPPELPGSPQLPEPAAPGAPGVAPSPPPPPALPNPVDTTAPATPETPPQQPSVVSKTHPNLSLRPPSPDAQKLLQRAENAYSAGRLNDAITLYQTVREFYPNWAYAEHAQMMVGVSEERLGRLRDAIASYERAIKDYPDTPGFSESTYYYLGSAYQRSGEPKRAAAAYQACVDLCNQTRRTSGFPFDDAKQGLDELSRE